jgi:hypothetical protein
MIKINPYHVLNLTPKVDAPCLSLYASSERELAQLIEKAEELGLKSYDGATVDRLLKPMHTAFKYLGSSGLAYPIALFSTKGFSGYAKLPFATKPLSVVASSFHVKPLLKWMQREHPFSLLSMREKEAILYQGSLSYFEELERLEYRELRTMDGVFNALDRAVYRSIQSSRVPLILAGDVELIEIYKSVSGYRGIVDDSIVDPNIFEDLERLHTSSVKILEPFLEQKEASHLNSYLVAERGGRTSSVLQEIVQLALARKIKHLFVNEKMNVWGKIDHETGAFTYSPKQTETTDDVLDDLAEIVVRNHGLVTVLPPNKMPGGRAACAILTGSAYSLRLSSNEYASPRETWSEHAVS